MSYKHLRFVIGSGQERQREIQKLVSLGVKSIVAHFEPDCHPERSSTYDIVMQEGKDYSDLDNYFKGTENVIPVTEEDLVVMENAPIIYKDRRGNEIK